MTRERKSHQRGSLPRKANTTTATTTTVNRKAVPQRGWAVENRRTLSTSSGSPALVGVHRHVLGAVVGEDAPYIGEEPDDPDVPYQHGHPDQPFYEVDEYVGREYAFQGHGGDEGHDEEQAHGKGHRYDHGAGHDPARNLFVLPDLVLDGHRGRAIEGLDP